MASTSVSTPHPCHPSPALFAGGGSASIGARDNNLISKTDRKNQTLTYTYDQLNRLTKKTYPDSSTVAYTYDNASRLTQVVDPTGTYSFTFDNMGRNSNPGLTPEIFDKCFKTAFPEKNPPTRTWVSYAQREYNSSDQNAGWHYHLQFFGGRGNSAGFAPDPIHEYGH